ncbi:MAG TPA: YtxH domain-containing protein [Candidatus Dormibacteraeota bacterium]|nr:YtxH domain-containing protein [Candidatus Dormibacteraeota bacterium]
MGYAKGLSHGLAIGLAVGVLTAPRAGTETRQKLMRTLTSTKERSQRMGDRVQQGWQIAQPALDRASHAAGGVARAVQPVAQGATERFVELAGRSEKPVPPPVPGFDHPN